MILAANYHLTLTLITEIWNFCNYHQYSSRIFDSNHHHIFPIFRHPCNKVTERFFLQKLLCRIYVELCLELKYFFEFSQWNWHLFSWKISFFPAKFSTAHEVKLFEEKWKTKPADQKRSTFEQPSVIYKMMEVIFRINYSLFPNFSQNFEEELTTLKEICLKSICAIHLISLFVFVVPFIQSYT